MDESTTILSSLLVASHWCLAIGLSARVVFRRLPVGVSLAWLAAIFGFPFLGATAYFIFGGKRLDEAWLGRQRRALSDSSDGLTFEQNCARTVQPDGSRVGSALHREILGALGIPALCGNHLQLLDEFDTVFDAIIVDIDGCVESCRIASYIWHDGGRADEVLEALLRASRRGVRCRVLVDAVGSKPFLAGTGLKKMRDADVQVVVALPRSLRRRADLRYHRKCIVIDDRIAYAGSHNIVDPRYFKQHVGVGRWVDAFVRIEGPAAVSLARMFEVDWSVEGVVEYEAPSSFADVGDTGSLSPSSIVQVVPSGPAPDPDVIRQVLLTAIYSARESLTLTTPYFVPDEAILTALYSACARGVDVTLLVPAKNDSILVRYASVAHFDNLLEAGARIARFKGGLLHTKSMVIDGSMSLFGSVNLDMRSFWLDFEVTLVIQDDDFARRLSALHDEYLSHSAFLSLDVWRKRSKYRRWVENAARLIGPLL